MNEGAAELRAVSTGQIERVMRHAVGSSTAELADWEWHSVPYHTVLPDRTLARVTGVALVGRHERVRWSSVVKVIRRPESRPPSEITGGTREFLAYRSGLLADLPGPLRAPRIYAIDEDDAKVWLWLEDLADIYARRWPLEQFGLAARHLGLFNGAYLTSRALPRDPWLDYRLSRHQAELRNGLQRSSTYTELQQVVRHPRVQHLLGATIASRTARLLQDQARFVEALSRLPQTLCHHEPSLAHLFAVRCLDGQLETAAVDWESVGPGWVGADIATMVFGTLRRCEFDAARATEFDQAVFTGYVDGLREAGWQGRVEEVRLGFTAAVGLRWGVLASLLRGLVDGALQVQRPSQEWQVSPEALVAQCVHVCAYLLDRADEAGHLVADVASVQ